MATINARCGSHTFAWLKKIFLSSSRLRFSYDFKIFCHETDYSEYLFSGRKSDLVVTGTLIIFKCIETFIGAISWKCMYQFAMHVSIFMTESYLLVQSGRWPLSVIDSYIMTHNLWVIAYVRSPWRVIRRSNLNLILHYFKWIFHIHVSFIPNGQLTASDYVIIYES